MKKLLLKVFLLALILSVLLVVVGCGEGGGTSSGNGGEQSTPKIEYKVALDGSHAVVTGYNGNEAEIVIASTYKKRPVTTIDSCAFDNCDSLQTVMIPHSVTSIGEYAFARCSNLKQVTLGNSVETIYSYAFDNCDSLQTVVIPDSVTSIGEYAFARCSNLKQVTLGNSVETIYGGAFLDCENLETLTVPASIKTIVGLPFSNCYKLATVNYLGTIDQWVEIEFGGTYTMLEYGARLYIDGEVVENVKLTAATKVANSVFCHYKWLKSVDTGNTVTSIGKGSFAGCTALTSVIVGNNVEAIGYDAFDECSALETITIGNKVTSIGDFAFEDCTRLTKVIYNGTVDQWAQTDFGFYQGNPLTNGAKLYINNLAVENVVLNNATKVGNRAFEGYTNLKSVTLGDNVETIGQAAFYGCTNLSKIDIPQSVTRIEMEAFFRTSISYFIVPSTVQYVGAYAFCTYNRQMVIYCETASAPSAWDPTWNNNGGEHRNLVYGYKYLMKDNVLYGIKGDHAEVIEQPRNSGITSAVICDSVTYEGNSYDVTLIADSAFSSCVTLKSVVIGNNITTIDEDAFLFCSRLTTVTMGKNVTKIGGWAFSHCSELTKIVIPAGVTKIGAYAFSNCNKATIYCQATSQPSGWTDTWNSDNLPVVWGYTGN